APSSASVGGIVPHHRRQWEESCPIIGVSGRNRAPSSASVGGICPIIAVSGRNSAPSLLSVGGIVPHHCCQWEE
ncbi:unnamed protein product, partial [Staurois parvus]